MVLGGANIIIGKGKNTKPQALFLEGVQYRWATKLKHSVHDCALLAMV